MILLISWEYSFHFLTLLGGATTMQIIYDWNTVKLASYAFGFVNMGIGIISIIAGTQLIAM
ncbi:MAG: hypothetical protein ACFFDH_06040 [Promethearchaeota archaeon]